MADEQPQFVRWEDVAIEQMSATIGRQFVHTSTMMLARVLLAKGSVVPMHSHANEQFTYILEGALLFRIDGREITVRAGEVLMIPPNVPHEAEALEDTIDLDIFNPPRMDWIARDDAYLRGAGVSVSSAGPGISSRTGSVPATVNDDSGLEREADTEGSKQLQAI